MTDPQRASRKWVIFAVASIWVISVGEWSENASQEQTSGKTVRTLSLFRRGFVVLLALSLRSAPLPAGTFSSLPWPTSSSSPARAGSASSRKKTYP